MSQEHKEITDTLALILERMATKDDLAELEAKMATKVDLAALEQRMDEGFASIRAEIKSIHTRLDELEEIVNRGVGMSKEIDYVLEQQKALSSRIQVIEQQLGIAQKAV